MKEQRPNPEELLKRVLEEEQQNLRGKLKIYFGAAPGVGKTYTMLKDAVDQRSQGQDVIIGIIESHGRKEIERLCNDFEILPRLPVDYHGTKLLEFDLNAAIKRNPSIILVDEMAHTNPPSLRHAKRWQDIKEVLDCGIDVYTTLNVQHIESLNDIVAQIIGTNIRETVPDSVFDMADTVEIVDLPPDDLLRRLREGKVYFPARAEIAAENFFRKGNLIALRDLALRVTAEHVETEVFLYRHGRGIQRIWPTTEKILVCVGPETETMKVIRTARRLATSLQSEWIAVHVDASWVRLSKEERQSVIQNLRFAERLGAETKILAGSNIVNEIFAFAREQNITKILVGKKIRPRWKSWFVRSLADEIVRSSEEIDVYIITGAFEPSKKIQSVFTKRIIPWSTYGMALLIVTLATGVDFALFPFLGHSNLIMVYLLGVVIVAMYGQIGPSILASILSVLAYDYFFVPPRFSFAVSDIQYVFTLLVMLLVTQIISHLTILTRRQVKIAHHIQKRTAILHRLTRQLAGTRGVNNLLEVAIYFISDTFNSEVLVLLSKNGQLEIWPKGKDLSTLNDKEMTIAQWVYNMGQIAGFSTDTLSFSDAIYIPLLSLKETIGVLRVKPEDQEQLLIPEQIRLLEDCANQIALSIEADRVQENVKKH